jgi:hypothetical protein
MLLQHISESLGEPLNATSQLATHSSNVSTSLCIGRTSFGSIAELITSINGRLVLSQRAAQRGNVSLNLGGATDFFTVITHGTVTSK